MPQSSGEMRTPTRNAAGTAARTARVTSRRRRARAENDSPPQPSVRTLRRLRNWQSRYPWAPWSSTPSKPARWARRAASRKAAMTRSMSSVVAARGAAGSPGISLALQGWVPVTAASARAPPWKSCTSETAPAVRSAVARYAESGLLRVVEDAELARPALPVPGDVRGAGGDDAEAAVRALLEPRRLGGAERAVGVALGVGHRGEGHPVPGARAVAEREGREEVASSHGARSLAAPGRATRAHLVSSPSTPARPAPRSRRAAPRRARSISVRSAVGVEDARCAGPAWRARRRRGA